MQVRLDEPIAYSAHRLDGILQWIQLAPERPDHRIDDAVGFLTAQPVSDGRTAHGSVPGRQPSLGHLALKAPRHAGGRVQNGKTVLVRLARLGWLTTALKSSVFVKAANASALSHS